MSKSSDGVDLRELRDLQDDFRAAARELPGDIEQSSRTVAATIAGHARSAAAGLGGVAAHVAPSIHSETTSAGGAVVFGGSSYPMAEGAEFGGRGRPTTQQFQPFRGSTGYFVYPTIRGDAAVIEAAYEDRVDVLLRKHRLT